MDLNFGVISVGTLCVISNLEVCMFINLHYLALQAAVRARLRDATGCQTG